MPYQVWGQHKEDTGMEALPGMEPAQGGYRDGDFNLGLEASWRAGT